MYELDISYRNRLQGCYMFSPKMILHLEDSKEFIGYFVGKQVEFSDEQTHWRKGKLSKIDSGASSYHFIKNSDTSWKYIRVSVRRIKHAVRRLPNKTQLLSAFIPLSTLKKFNPKQAKKLFKLLKQGKNFEGYFNDTPIVAISPRDTKQTLYRVDPVSGYPFHNNSGTHWKYFVMTRKDWIQSRRPSIIIKVPHNPYRHAFLAKLDKELLEEI